MFDISGNLSLRGKAAGVGTGDAVDPRTVLLDDVRDPDTVAHLFWAAVHGLVSLELAGKLNLGRDLASLVAPMQETLFTGNSPRTGSKEKTK